MNCRMRAHRMSRTHAAFSASLTTPSGERSRELEDCEREDSEIHEKPTRDAFRASFSFESSQNQQLEENLGNVFEHNF